MEIAIPGIVILILLIIIYVRIKIQQKLLEEAKRYETLLRDSRLIRWQYFQCIEKSKEILKEYEQMSNKLQGIKAELLGIRSDLRDDSGSFGRR